MIASCIVSLIKAYQFFISPWLRCSCRFVPSCSCYGVEAIKKHGVCYGGLLVLWRLLRCQPFSSGGYDPVPSCRFFGTVIKKNKQTKMDTH